MKRFLVRLWKDEEGQDLIEYGLLLVFIALICIATIRTLGGAVSDIFANAVSNITQ